MLLVRFLSQPFIRMGMSDGVNRGKECEDAGRSGMGLARDARKGFPYSPNKFIFQYYQESFWFLITHYATRKSLLYSVYAEGQKNSYTHC